MTLELNKPNREQPCPIQTQKQQLDQADANILEQAIQDKGWPIPALKIALHQNGINIPEKRLYDHRNGVCKCSKN